MLLQSQTIEFRVIISEGKLSFDSIVFGGNLQITDAEKFKETLIRHNREDKTCDLSFFLITKILSF
jgi:hypothetical protein